MSEVHPYPEWKSAVEKFLRQGFSDGEILTHDWLFAALLLRKPDNETPYQDAKRTEILFLQRFQKFQRHLLEEHQIDLVSVTGVGYRITPPQEQTECQFFLNGPVNLLSMLMMTLRQRRTL